MILRPFDAEIVARAMRQRPFLSGVGIGHTGDHSVADEVANMAYATPTACGEAVAARVALYWEGVVERALAALAASRVRDFLGAQDQMSRLIVNWSIGEPTARSS